MTLRYLSGGLAALVLLAGPALAQRTPLYQSGKATPGAIATFERPGAVKGVTGLQGDASGLGVAPFAVTDSLGLGQCVNSAPTGGQYNALCLGHDPDGNAVLQVDSYGGLGPKGLKVRLNGVDYDALTGAPVSLQAPTDVYVATNGNDANNCKDTAHACRTVARAYAAGTGLLNTSGGNLNINLAAGSYNESVFFNQPLTGAANAKPNPNGTANQPGQVMLIGAGSGTTTLTGGGSCGTVVASNYATVGLRKLRLVGNSNFCQSTLFVQIGATVNLYDDLDFGPATIDQIHIENAGSQVQAWYSYKISGGAHYHIDSGSLGFYLHSGFPSGVISFSGTPSFANSFVLASQGGVIQFNGGITWSGSFIGRRYDAYANGVIITYPSTSKTWIPGTIAGSVDTGSRYVGTYEAVVAARRGSGQGVTIQPAETGTTQIGYSSSLASPLSGNANGPGLGLYTLSNANSYVDALAQGGSTSNLHLRSYGGSGVYRDFIFDNQGIFSTPVSGRSTPVTGAPLGGAYFYMLSNADAYVDALAVGGSTSNLHLRASAGAGIFTDAWVSNLGQFIVGAGPATTQVSGSVNPAGLYAYMTTNANGYIDAVTQGGSTTNLHLRTYAGAGVFNDTMIDAAGRLNLGAALILKPLTFGQLPACSGALTGALVRVPDSNANTWGTAISGSGAADVMAYCNGGGSWHVAGI